MKLDLCHHILSTPWIQILNNAKDAHFDANFYLNRSLKCGMNF